MSNDEINILSKKHSVNIFWRVVLGKKNFEYNLTFLMCQFVLQV